MHKEWSKDVFAKNLHYYMMRANKNQKEMAAIVGVSAPTFNEWLKGKKFPRIDKVERLAQYFGILKSDLIEEKTSRQKIQANTSSLTAEDIELLRLFHSVPKNIQDAVIAMLKSQAPKEETYTIKIAARNGEPIREVTITDSEYEKIKNLPDVDI